MRPKLVTALVLIASTLWLLPISRAIAQSEWRKLSVPEVNQVYRGLVVEPGKSMLLWGWNGALLYDLESNTFSYPTYDFPFTPSDHLPSTDLATPRIYSDTIFAVTDTYYRNTAGTGYDIARPWILRSENGGRSWQSSDSGVGDILGSRTIAIDPRDTQHMLWSGGSLYPPFPRESFDGGRTWNEHKYIIDGAWMELCSPSKIAFSSCDEGVVLAATHAGSILRSTDSGASWTRIWSGASTNGQMMTALAQDWHRPEVWYATREQGEILVSVDNGLTFELRGANEYLFQPMNLSPDPYHHGRVYAIGASACLRSNDYGETWVAERPVKSPVPYWNVVIDPSTGRSFLFIDKDMYERVDDQWNLKEIPGNTSMGRFGEYQVKHDQLHWSDFSGHVNELNLMNGTFHRWADEWSFDGFTVSDDDQMLRAAFGYQEGDEYGLHVTRDGGQSWEEWNSGPLPMNQEDMTFVHPDTILAISESEIVRYWNGGREQLGFPPASIMSAMIREDRVLVASSSEIYLSTNRGRVFSGVFEYPVEQQGPFLRGDLLAGGTLIAGSYNSITVSRDGGETWVSANNYPGQPSLYSTVIGDTALLLSTSDSKIYANVRGSDDWFEYPAPLPDGVLPNDVAGNDQWLIVTAKAPAGDPQLYYRPAGTTGVGEGWQALPTDFALDTPWPNPFNPSTSISYSIPEAGRVRLEVFDMLARSVATLQEGVVAAGPHVATFDGSGLASGAYLVRLESDGHTATRRIVLVK